MSYYPRYKSSSNNIKVVLDLNNYATKTDLKNITHVDVSSFASKTNLAALKTEVDKDVDKLKTTPTDLTKLSNVVKNNVVKKTDYNTKVTSVEAQIAGLTKNTVDNLADITKLKAIDTNSFVTRTKFSADTNTLDDKIDGVEKNPPDISGLATKTSLNGYIKTSAFNSKVTEVENKIKDADIVAKSANIENSDDYEDVSYDVESLFTSIPIKETIDYIIHKIYTKNVIEPMCKKSIFKKLLIKLTKECTFLVNNQLIKQIDGCPMGGPISVVFADIYMCKMENDVVAPIKPLFYKRYVDDTYVRRKKNTKDELFGKLNTYHKNIKLTTEKKSDKVPRHRNCET